MARKMAELKEELLRDEEFCAEFVRLEDEFALAAQLIEARKKAHLTQEEVAAAWGRPSRWWRAWSRGIRCRVCAR